MAWDSDSMPLPSWRQLSYGKGRRLKPDSPGFKFSWASVLTSLKSHSVTSMEKMICALQAPVPVPVTSSLRVKAPDPAPHCRATPGVDGGERGGE